MPAYFTPTRFSDNIRETPEGFLVCIGVPIARTGEMIYAAEEVELEPDEEGKVVITRDEAEVFRLETIASFEGKPVTIGHPREFVTPENWSWLAKGILQNVRRGEGEYKDSLLADVLVTDAMAINLVKAGLREVSCGYQADYDQDEDGKGKQSNIIGNHLALVEQGRAGSSYAINDHKGKVRNMPKLKERLKSLFGGKSQPTLDQVLKTIDENTFGSEKKAKDEKMEEEKKAKDEKAKEEKTDDATNKVGVTVWDAEAAKKMYDELAEMVKDIGEKISKLGQPQDSAEKIDKEGDKTVSGDAPIEASLEDRLKVVETGLAKLLEMEAGEEGYQTAATDEKDDEETEDDDFEETTMTGDEKSRIEILAPGHKPAKDFKSEALKAAYKTKEGKTVIDSLTGNKPTFDSAEKVDTLFIAASEVLKAKRTSDFSKTKEVKDSAVTDVREEMTAERMNELNKTFYAKK